MRTALDLEGLAPILRRAGHRVAAVYDPGTLSEADNVAQHPGLARALWPPSLCTRRLLAARPDVALIAVVPGTLGFALAVARELRAARPRLPVILCGLLPTLVPEQVLREPAVAFVLQGELEGALLPLLCALRGGASLDHVGNLWLRGPDGRPRFTHAAPLVDLDGLPLPDKTLFEPFVSHAYSYVTLVSRGCRNHCTFCEETCLGRIIGPGYFRRKKVNTVIRELTTGLRRYGFREVIFKDSYLNDEPAWLFELLERYRREVARPFKCFAHIRGFDEPMARRLRASGCYAVEFGLQTWNPEERRALGRRETTEDALAAFRACAAAGLGFDVDHLLGLPGETDQDHRRAVLAYARLPGLNRVKVHYLSLLPTAPIVARCREAGDLPEDALARLALGESRFFFRSPDRPRTGEGSPDVDARAGFAQLLRLLPLVPEPLVAFLVDRRTALRCLARLPGGLVAALMAAIALGHGDLRFAAYLRLYPRKLLFSLIEAARPVWRPWADAPDPGRRGGR